MIIPISARFRPERPGRTPLRLARRPRRTADLALSLLVRSCRSEIHTVPATAHRQLRSSSWNMVQYQGIGSSPGPLWLFVDHREHHLEPVRGKDRVGDARRHDDHLVLADHRLVAAHDEPSLALDHGYDRVVRGGMFG